MKSSKKTTKEKATKVAVGKTLEWHKQQRVRELFGTIEYYEEYDYKRARKRKS